MKGWILALLLLLTLGGCSADDTAVTQPVPDALPVEQEADEPTKPDTPVVEQEANKPTKPDTPASQPEEKPTVGSSDCRPNAGGPGSGVVG